MLFGRSKISLFPSPWLIVLWGLGVIVAFVAAQAGDWTVRHFFGVSLTITGTCLLADAIHPPPDVGRVTFQNGFSMKAVVQYVREHQHVAGAMSFKPLSYYGGLLLLLSGILLS